MLGADLARGGGLRGTSGGGGGGGGGGGAPGGAGGSLGGGSDAATVSDKIRALAARCLLGLARDNSIRHILAKLQVGCRACQGQILF